MFLHKTRDKSLTFIFTVLCTSWWLYMNYGAFSYTNCMSFTVDLYFSFMFRSHCELAIYMFTSFVSKHHCIVFWPYRNLKLPSLRPSIVCENCLYSQEKDRRARAFHIMDPKGILEMLLIFLEDRGDGVLFHPSLESNSVSCMTIYEWSADSKELVFA